MVDKQIQINFLTLVRLGIGNPICQLPQTGVDWSSILYLAEQQGLSAIVLDGIEKLSEEQRPAKDLLLQWIGNAMHNYEYRYELYQRAIAELAHFYNKFGYKMMLLKGLACGINWPRPEHRPCGDIDIWQFGQQKEADEVLTCEKGVEIDITHHHHTVFSWQGFTVENHYDFINTHHHKSNYEFEGILKDLGRDDSYTMDLYGETVFLPSPMLHAMFMLKHLMMHFAADKVTIRQLLDWAFFVKANSNIIDWKWLIENLERFGMVPAFNIFNSICVDDLGFETDLFPKSKCDEHLKQRVLRDLVSPEFNDKKPKTIIRRVLYKYRRWRANSWKHKLCYKESLWSAFWSGVWNHLLKPSSI